jgi:hypothetical protein
MPRVLPYIVLFVLFTVTFGGTLLMPEPVTNRSHLKLTPQWPNVPSTTRRAFMLAALAVISSWSIGGLFLAVGPQLFGALFHTNDHLVAGTGVFALTGAGAVGQIVFRSTMPWAGAAGGSLALAVGLVALVIAAEADSGALFLAGALVGGTGFGVAFLGALRVLSAAIPQSTVARSCPPSTSSPTRPCRCP